LTTTAGFQAAIDRGDYVDVIDVYENYGQRLMHPIIIKDMDPGTHYYIGLREDAWNGLGPLSNLVEVSTLNITLPNLVSRPGVLLDSNFIQELKNRKASSDQGWLD
jgi:hypothetical protein